MKKTATRAGSGQQAESDLILPAASQAVLDLESHSGWTGVPAEAADQSQGTASDPSVSVAAGSDETAQEPLTLPSTQIRGCSEKDAWQRLVLLGAIPADSFYSPTKAKDGYYRKTLKRALSSPATDGFVPQPKPAKRKDSKRPIGFGKAMQCFERCVEIQAKRERNSLRRRARLLAAAKALGIAAYVNRQEIAQRVLEAKQRTTGEVFQALTAADRAAMPKPVVRWLLPGLLPAGDLTIIGGRPKVGKTRLAMALVAAVLNGEAVLDLPAPAKAAPVILVTDDQGDGDSAEMMDALGLWLHPGLVWSRHFRLTEPDLDGLLDAIKANPGALVVIDSLRSVSRALQFGENDPEIGATLYDLKQAVIDAGGTLLLIHHCNKTADAVGLEALSGHSSIGGAANTILTMHYLPGENGQPNKEAPERRLYREPRSGEGFDIVITRGAAGGFRKVSTLSQWQKQVSEAKKNQKMERVTDLQQRALDALNDSGAWMTRRQVCEAIGVTWTDRGRIGDARKVGDSLHRLVELERVESVRPGTEATFRASHEAQKDNVTTVPINDTRVSQCREKLRDNRDKARLSPGGRDTENDCNDSQAHLSRTSQPLYDPRRQENEQRIRELGRSNDLSGWSNEDVADLLQSLEKAARRKADSGLLV